MIITSIISERKYKNAPSYHTIFEWEDIISKEFPLKMLEESLFKKKTYSLFRKLKITEAYHLLLPNRKCKSLRFIMNVFPEKYGVYKSCRLNKNTIPVIIDFWLSKNELDNFYDAYKHCSLILITSAEVVEFLKQNKCPLNIAHWPLSFPDKYRIRPGGTFKKKYDFCLIGRPDPFFLDMLKKYESEYSDFTYVVSQGTGTGRTYWTNKGEFVGKDMGRESYIEMIRKTKITCYSTPGLDKTKDNPINGFNQVTPRLFEMIAGGCYVIGHYEDNPDTSFYELRKYIPNVNSYAEFKAVLDNYRSAEIADPKVGDDMLSKHYTSTRVPMLKSIMKLN
jgi:hypothetical protein